LKRSPQIGPWIDINTIQIIRRVALFVLAAILGVPLLRVGAAWGPERLERAGLTACATALVCSAVVCRVWASLYISTRKSSELVTLGPYSVTRNPLYLSSVIGTFGALLQFGSIVVSVFAAFVVYVIFMVVIIQEERSLSSLHKREYQKYREEVPRFWPRWSRVRSVPTLPVTLAPVIRTIVDSSFFFVTVPLSALTAVLQHRFPDLLLFRLP
jgi:protein-S-isoprenylcysteine O-methyltransferase Ste14